MAHIQPQKNYLAFLVSGGGGRWLANQCKSPAVPVLMSLLGLVDAHNVVSCSQSMIADALGYSLPTVKRAFKDLKRLGVLKVLKRGSYALLSCEALERKYHNDTLGGLKYHNDTLGGRKYHNDTLAPDEGTKSGVETVINKLPLRGSSSAGVRPRATTAKDKQEKIRKLEEIVVSNLGATVWAQSTNWFDLIDRANWDLAVVTDSCIAYREKVIDAGQRHQFSRLMNFVKREAQSKAQQEKKHSQPRPNYKPPSLHSEGSKITENEMAKLKGLIGV